MSCDVNYALALARVGIALVKIENSICNSNIEINEIEKRGARGGKDGHSHAPRMAKPSEVSARPLKSLAEV
jgi:hypothetical protein